MLVSGGIERTRVRLVLESHTRIQGGGLGIATFCFVDGDGRDRQRGAGHYVLLKGNADCFELEI